MKPSEKKALTLETRARHHAALETLRAPGCETSGLALWRKLRRIEARAHDATTAQCNGTAYGTQPFRSDEEMDEFSDAIRQEVTKAFGGALPEGFTLNHDPRGYALKLRGPEAGRPAPPIPAGLEKDWGGNGLLAAEIA